MGHRSSKPILKPAVVDHRLSPNEKDDIKMEFQVLANTRDLENGRIGKETFIVSYLKTRLPRLSGLFLERLFSVLAYRGKDDINFDEFKQAKVLLDHVPAEPITGEMDLYDVRTQSYHDKLQLLFHLMDLDFNGRITKKDMKKVLPLMMQDASIQEYTVEQLAEMDLWYDAITQFAMLYFDHTDSQALNFRDFQGYARRDFTIQEFLKMLSPQQDDFPSMTYARQLAQEAKRREDEYKSKMVKTKPDTQESEEKEAPKEEDTKADADKGTDETPGETPGGPEAEPQTEAQRQQEEPSETAPDDETRL